MLLVKEMADNGDSSDGPVLQKIPQMSMASHDPRYEAQYDDALEFDPERGMEDLQMEFCRPSPSRGRPFRLARNVVEDRLEQPRGPMSRRREVDQQGAESAGSINAAMAAFLLRPDEPLHIDARKVFEALQQAGAATLDDAVGVLEKRDVLGKAGVERLCLRWCFLGSDKKRIVAALVVLWGSERGCSVSKTLEEAARDLLRQGGVTDDRKKRVFGNLDLETASSSASGVKAEH